MQWLRQKMLTAVLWLLVLTHHRGLCLRELSEHLLLRAEYALRAASPSRSQHIT